MRVVFIIHFIYDPEGNSFGSLDELLVIKLPMLGHNVKSSVECEATRGLVS